jgi:acetyl-CoA C-acetyltransferase
MGLTAENVAAQAGITRHEMDLYAARSQAYAARAVERGFFAAEIAPISTPDGAVVTRDDCPRPDTTLDKLAALKPAFREDGTVTAGNACPLNDGAAALVVLSERRAAQLGLAPLGRVVCSAISALDPALMGLGPVEATRRALARAGLALPDLELVEMNEAFAAQVLASARALELPLDRLNVNGGAIALGHPFGMTGARLVQTLLHALAERRARYGLATLCAAGGQGLSMVLERLT